MRCLRTHDELGQKTILATAVLLNISRMWSDDDEGFGEDDTDDQVEERNDGNFIVQDMAEASIRLRGQVERDRLKDTMPA